MVKIEQVDLVKNKKKACLPDTCQNILHLSLDLFIHGVLRKLHQLMQHFSQGPGPPLAPSSSSVLDTKFGSKNRESVSLLLSSFN